MLKILIVDDDASKITNIKTVLLSLPEINDSCIEVCSDLNSAKQSLSENGFDLLILDLALPERFGDKPEIDGGLLFLQELSLDPSMRHPFHILGITAYTELVEQYQKDFSSFLWHLIKYDPGFSEWRSQLINYVNYLIKSKSELNNFENIYHKFDIGIVTALNKPELEQVLKLDANWEEFRLNNDYSVYYKGVFQNASKRLTVVAACAVQMGMTATSVIAQKIIHNFRPRFLIMAGIAAGIRDKGNFGDILFADLSWDYGSGKISTKRNGDYFFKQDPRPIPLSPEIKTIALDEELKKSFLQEIKSKWNNSNGFPVKTDIDIHVGPLASGSYVIENVKKVQEVVDQQRKLIGIDMETYAVFFNSANASLPKPIPMSIKSICDYGDSSKNDEYQMYAAFTSANYIYNFALKYL